MPAREAKTSMNKAPASVVSHHAYQPRRLKSKSGAVGFIYCRSRCVASTHQRFCVLGGITVLKGRRRNHGEPRQPDCRGLWRRSPTAAGDDARSRRGARAAASLRMDARSLVRGDRTAARMSSALRARCGIACAEGSNPCGTRTARNIRSIGRDKEHPHRHGRLYGSGRGWCGRQPGQAGRQSYRSYGCRPSIMDWQASHGGNPRAPASGRALGREREGVDPTDGR